MKTKRLWIIAGSGAVFALALSACGASQSIDTANGHLGSIDQNSGRIAEQLECMRAMSDAVKSMAESFKELQKLGVDVSQLLAGLKTQAPPATTQDIEDLLPPLSAATPAIPTKE
jgi:hypothetical protein